MDIRLQHPFSCVLAGPSNSGKSYFVKNLLENAHLALSQTPTNVVWAYSCWQPLYQDLERRIPNLKFVEGLPATLSDDDLFPPSSVNMLIVDDLMATACDSQEIEKAFTQYVHHRNLSIIYIVQNLFCQGKSSRTIALNTKYMVLFKNPRDKLQITTLAKQMYPGRAHFFLEAFEDATQKPYGYLFVDLNASTPEDYRLRSGLFPPDWPVAYTLKKATAAYKRKM